MRTAINPPEPAPLPVVTRALLDSLTLPSLEITRLDDDSKAYLIPLAERGPVTIWRTADSSQVVLREGLVTATRGLGRDVASSDYESALTAIQQRGGWAGRRLFIRNDTGGLSRVNMTCRVEYSEQQTIEIVEQFFETELLLETCEFDGGGQIQNRYWVDLYGTRIWQSEQWVGPENGHLRIRLLKP